MTDRTETKQNPAAIATAEWWADRVFGGASASSGDGMIDAFSVLSGAQGQPAERTKRDRFIEALAERVGRQLARDGAERFGITLSVDYGPEGALVDVASELGIRNGSFPWKTNTWTYPTHAIAASGYGARTVLIWQAEDWERPTCGQGQWDLATPDGGRLPWKCSALNYHESDHVFDAPDPLCTALVDRHGKEQACGRPVSDEHHATGDSYLSRWAHEFQAGA